MQKKTKVILIVVALCILLFFGGCAGLLWFAWSSLKGMITHDPVVVEQLGEIEECELDLDALERDEKKVVIFQVRGTKGSGQVRLDGESSGHDGVWGTLVVGDKTFELKQ
ncbi:MAG: hypothetical protein KDC38_17820 [Planctomycetes bacterium]|nr:hypothetical protein [Planctomycetota bacterium]